MNISKPLLLSALAIAASASAPALAQSTGIVGASSAPDNGTFFINVGVSEGNAPPYHVPGRAGIGVSTVGYGKRIDFIGLSNYATTTTAVNGTTVYSVNMPITPVPGTTDHSGMGYFNFARIGTGDVWIGEWSKNGLTADPNDVNFQNRQVYYAGNKAGFSLPTTSTSATYQIRGIQHFSVPAASLAVYTGTLHATLNASGGSFYGSLGNGFVNLNLGSASATIAINANGGFDKTGAGTALSGLNGTVIASGGHVKGDFFGAQAKDVAGIVTFAGTNRTYDTAFGGSKSP